MNKIDQRTIVSVGGWDVSSNDQMLPELLLLDDEDFLQLLLVNGNVKEKATL